MALGRTWATAIELEVEINDATAGTASARPVIRALAYQDLVGTPTVGSRVLLNTSALNLELGTGGFALVVALPDNLPRDPQGPGHLVKGRYTPLQSTVLGVDEQDSPHHELLRDADDLQGLPVVVADLHSSLPAIIAGIRQHRPDTVVAYVATDGGALPLAFSQTVVGLTDAGWLAGSVTVGQAYGGDLEAVTIHNGLLAARLVLGADVAVVTQGPGNLGTGTRWGFSGMAAGESINAAALLQGRPVAALRISQADERDRHHGISHHSLTAYGQVAHSTADVPVPDFDGDFGRLVHQQAQELGTRHRIILIGTEGLPQALADCPVTLSTMGRGLADDPSPFIAAAAAGRHAATLLDG